VVEQNLDFARARAVRSKSVGNILRMRGVIEFTNVCFRNCHYCGMRRANGDLSRYVLTPEEIVAGGRCVAASGVRIVMLQAGDHLRYELEGLVDAVRELHHSLGLVVLLCVGDRKAADYLQLFEAGASQAILKFETSNAELYRSYRPHSTLDNRLGLLRELHGMGYDVSSGFIVGLPGTTKADHERDLALLTELPLFAASVSPFVPNEGSPLAGSPYGQLEPTLHFMARMRVLRPELWIPSVSALNLVSRLEGRGDEGQSLGLAAGANVLTVNFTPREVRSSYSIYTLDRYIVELEYARALAGSAGLVID
jgi:biotin synthase